MGIWIAIVVTTLVFIVYLAFMHSAAEANKQYEDLVNKGLCRIKESEKTKSNEREV